MFDLLSRLPDRLLLLKALQKKHITIPAYTKADGTYVPAHGKLVNYNPDHKEVVSGKSSHSHKEALKKLAKDPAFKQLPVEHQSHLVQGHAQDIQTAASKGAQVSVFKKQVLAGQKPGAANLAAFKELLQTDPDKGASIRDSIIAAIGLDKLLELIGPDVMTPSPKAGPAGPTPEEEATASEKLFDIMSKAPGMHYPYLAAKKLTEDTKVWGGFKNSVEELQAVVDLAKQMQADATAGAKISTLTKKLVEGKVPSPSEMGAYAALDDNGKLKMAQAAIKKSGGKATFGTIVDLLKKGEEKAGITVDKPEAVPISTLGAKPAHFGEKHEGKALGTIGGSAVFKFEGGKWKLLLDTDDSWSLITNHVWEQKLAEGKHPATDVDLSVISDPSKSFGETNANKVFTSAGGPYKFKFASGKWTYGFKDSPGSATGNQFEEVKNESFLENLDAGKAPSGGPLVEVADETPAIDDGQWQFDPANAGFAEQPTYQIKAPSGLYFYVTHADGKWQAGSSDEDGDLGPPESFSSAYGVQSYLETQGVHPLSISALQDMGLPEGAEAEDASENGRDPLASDDTGWHYNPADHGFSGYSTLTFSDKENGVDWYVVGVDAIDAENGLYQVGKMTVDDMEPDFEDAMTAADVQAYFKKNGLKPPKKETIKQLATVEDPGGFDATAAAFGPGPHEGDTKQGVGGVLTLKDGHWTLDNAAVLSLWNHHAIKPGSATAISMVGCLQAMAENNSDQVMSQMASVKKSAQADGYAMAKINDMLGDLNSAYSKVIEHQLEQDIVAPAKPAAQPAATVADNYLYDHMLHFTDDKSNKFWQVTVDPVAKTATSHWGKIGTKGQSKTYQHSSASEAYFTAKDAASAKMKKGYKSQAMVDSGTSASHAKPPSFGTLNPNKVFSGVTALGATSFYKFTGGEWHFSFDPQQPGEWQPVSQHSKLHDALEQGQTAAGNTLLDLGPASEFGGGGFKPKDGWVYESTISSGKIVQFVNKGGVWHNVKALADGTPTLIPNVTASWTAALDKGEDINGQPLVEAYSFAAIGGSDDGPHEGDVKPGADGWLILKDGHWVKAIHAQVMAKFCPVPDDISSISLKQALGGISGSADPVAKSYKKIATTSFGMPNVTLTMAGGKFVGRAKKSDLGKAGKWEPFTQAMSAKNMANALNWLEHAQEVEKAVLKGKAPPPSPFAAVAAPAAFAASVAAPAGPMPSIDGWKKVGEQGGFNEGGTYADADGVQWYCKFPAGGAMVARNELLANKLYSAAGVEVPEVKLVTQGGKIGLASRIVVGAVKDKAALQAGKSDGLLTGFVADAWLSNWDVVGNNPQAGKGWDNIMFKDGKAVRIDPGGALLYGGAGGKKAAFGDDVIELETMRNAKINARTAKVFGKISDADLKASAEKVLAITDAQIEQLCKDHGPGNPLEKAALAKTLKARKAHIAAKFPTVWSKVSKQQAANVASADPGAAKSGKMKAEKKIVFKPEELSAAPDFLNWGGSGKHGPASLEAKNVANQQGVNQLLEVAKKGDPQLIKNVIFPLYDKDGNQAGSAAALDHPSQYVKGYAQQLTNEIDFQLNPPKVFQFREDSALGQLAASFPTIHKITSNLKRLGKYVLLGESSGFPETEVASYPKQTYKNGKITTSTFSKQSSEAWGKMPQLQRQAVQAYCGYKSGSINSALWAGNPSGQSASAMAALHTHAYELPAGLILSRKISLHGPVLEQLVGKDLVQGGTKTGQFGQGGATGKVLQEPAIGSTSISPDVWSGNVHLKMIVGPGVRGLYVGTPTGISECSNEKEMLLPPNTRMLVRSVRKSPSGGDPDGFGSGSQYIVEVLLLPTEVGS